VASRAYIVVILLALLDSFLLHLTAAVALDTGTATFLSILHHAGAGSHALHDSIFSHPLPTPPAFLASRCDDLVRLDVHAYTTMATWLGEAPQS